MFIGFNIVCVSVSNVILVVVRVRMDVCGVFSIRISVSTTPISKNAKNKVGIAAPRDEVVVRAEHSSVLFFAFVILVWESLAIIDKVLEKIKIK